MHEYALVQTLLERVDGEARALNATAVRRVIVRIGPFAGVERSVFASAFDACRTGTLCRDADLEIGGEEIAWRCEACGEPVVEGEGLACTNCRWPAHLTAGEALTLEQIDLEVQRDV